jgi:hypothetical protein
MEFQKGTLAFSLLFIQWAHSLAKLVQEIFYYMVAPVIGKLEAG